ncbi:MAG: four helix bundle protein [Ignavibacteriae bacterium]|nr:four helix bundle protein [Ignavibacteriota bacterium]
MSRLNHNKLEVYIKSSELVKLVYQLTNFFSNSELYGLTSQIRRSAISVISNLSEVASRKSELDRKRFYEISRSSFVELDTQIEIAFSLGFINPILKN